MPAGSVSISATISMASCAARCFAVTQAAASELDTVVLSAARPMSFACRQEAYGVKIVRSELSRRLPWGGRGFDLLGRLVGGSHLHPLIESTALASS